MSQLYAFAPLTGPNGLAANAAAVVATAGTPVSVALPTGQPGQILPQQLMIDNETSAWGTANIGTAAQVAANPATATFGIGLPPNSAIIITVDPSATNASVLLGAAGTGTVILTRGEGK